MVRELLTLSLIRGLGHRNIKYLIGYFGTPGAVFDSTKAQLQKIPNMRPAISDAILQKPPYDRADEIIANCEKVHCSVLPYLSEAYPNRLKMVEDAPVYLFKKGKGTLNALRAVAIVGTRKATSYGRSVTNKIVAALKDLNVQVISGLAFGIDIEAHKAAIEHRMSTLAIIAGGVNHLYPPQHKKQVDQMHELGAVISEQPPGTIPESHLFPARNRIIAGMSDATIVVEAAEKGGALITAALADSYGRPVLAIPGPIDQPYSVGTNRLIARQQALAYTEVQDLIEALGWENTTAMESREPPELVGEEKTVYWLLREAGKAVDIDLIATHSQLPINRTAAVLLSLEFQGLVKMAPGKKYRAS